MEPIDIGASFREAMRCDGRRGVDPELVTEGLGSVLARAADKAVGGLFSKAASRMRRKASGIGASFKEAFGDIGHTLRRDIEKIAKFGGNSGKWAAVVAGDLTQHMTKGLTGKGGVPANFVVPKIKMGNGKTQHDMPIAWAICSQSSLCDMVRSPKDGLPRISELLGTVANTINIAAYIQGAGQYGKAPYNDICSFIASGGEGQLPPAMDYDEDKDNSFNEAMNSLFQNGWRPANMQAMAGTINIICSQFYIQSFTFLADNGIVKFTDQWYEANKHLWGWSGDAEPTSDAGQDFDEQVRSKVVRANTAKNNGPMTNAKVCVAIAPPLAELAGKGENVLPAAIVGVVKQAVTSFQSVKTKNEFGNLEKGAEEAGKDADKFKEWKEALWTFFGNVGIDLDNKDIGKALQNDEDAINEWEANVTTILDWWKDWELPEDKDKEGKEDEEGEEGKEGSPEEKSEENPDGSAKEETPAADNGGAPAEGGAPAGDSAPARGGESSGGKSK